MKFYSQKHPDMCVMVGDTTYCCDGQGTPFLKDNKALCRFDKSDMVRSAVPVYDYWFNLLVLFAYIIMVVANVVAEILPLNGKTTAEISDSYPNLFTPTGLTFAIWGVIYLVWGVYVITQLFTVKSLDSVFHPHVNILFIMSCLLNTVWIFAWHFLEIALSLVLTISLFITLTLIYISVDNRLEGVTLGPKMSFAGIAVSIYYGWVTVATVANVTVYLCSIGWSGGVSEPTWTIIILGVIVFIGCVASIVRKDVLYVSVLIWAIIGIAIKREADTLNPQPDIVITCYIGIAVLGCSIIWGIYRLIKQNK